MIETPAPATTPVPAVVPGTAQLALRGPEGRRPRPRRRGGLTARALLAPAVAVLAAVVGWPLIQLFVMSFQEFGRAQVFGRPAPFVGLDNYRQVLTDGTFWTVLGRSLAFCAVNVVLTMVLGMLLALMMQRLPRAFRLMVSIGLLLAWAMPALAVTIVGGWMFDTEYGVVNYVLTQATAFDFTGHSWLSNPLSFFGVATLVVTWGAVPFVAFTLYAALTQVPDEVVEAAQIDGAGPATRFRHIVFPYIQSVFLVVTILEVIWDMRVFTQIYALQDIGGIREQTSTIGVYIVNRSVGSGEYGLGGAIAVILVVIMLVLSGYWIRRSLREEAS